MLPKRALPYSWDEPASGYDAPTAPRSLAADDCDDEDNWDEDEDWEAEQRLDFRAERSVRLVAAAGSPATQLRVARENSADQGGRDEGASHAGLARHAGADGYAGPPGNAGPAGADAPARSVGGGPRREPDGGTDDWKPPLSLRARLWRAVSAPPFAAATVFIVAIAIALGMVWAQPHAPEVASTGGTEASESALEAHATGDTEAGAHSGGTGTAAPTAGEKAAGSDASVFVHVVGAVNEPGVVELPASSRVRDAVAQAGGATDAAVLSSLNLARVLVDGEQIVVPDAAAVAAGGASAVAGEPGVMPGAPGQAAPPGGAVDLNTADQAMLETLPRVGPALAQRILDWRGTNGRFTSVDQLLDVPGIGEKTLAGFRDRVSVS